jgi:hypothetical protein
MIYPYTPEYHQYAHALTAAAPAATLYDFHGAAVDQAAAGRPFFIHCHVPNVQNMRHYGIAAAETS